MTIAWLSQQDAHGCGVATAAMLTGRSYRDVRDEIDSWGESPRDWSTQGCTHMDIDRVLVGHGYFTQTIYKTWAPSDAWPPTPFASAHYAQVVQPSGQSHFVVVLADGDVLDPFRQGRFRLGDWPDVNHVVGVAKP